jgi:hypothetical protein
LFDLQFSPFKREFISLELDANPVFVFLLIFVSLFFFLVASKVHCVLFDINKTFSSFFVKKSGFQKQKQAAKMEEMFKELQASRDKRKIKLPVLNYVSSKPQN